ncbi:hypothetical protein NBO_46g0007 [Nosema bombycis CQ1]|uniref:Uncharacterized protein n=1 Tax=Nosema bombycis (strain CQ1 / CVCC 102059) TaxID=578461 RepID=R0MEX2_NOSB1|nr:hypothetical protein NBO_380g0001 [Nosema bombycis CQ1]EOB13972.1 hypothetical protein NBO_46g0007 [Nosema bombycis CQ1]|eukprot:EOB12685.1 hypothetical protein NBO_380g0001 [Nosema bombycis CQ1]
MLENRKTWCTKKYLKKVRSTEILLRRKSIEPIKKTKSIREQKKIKLTPKKISTPKRIINIVSPGMYTEIKSNKSKTKYSSVRRIDFC